MAAQLHITDLCIRWRRVASHTPRPLYPQGVRHSLHTEEETGCSPEQFWAFWIRQESLFPVILRRCNVKCGGTEVSSANSDSAAGTWCQANETFNPLVLEMDIYIVAHHLCKM